MMPKLLALVLAISPFCVGATKYTWNKDMTCEYPIEVHVESLTCNGSPYCYGGDTVDVTGSVTILESLKQTEMCVTKKFCLMGASFLCKTEMEKMNVCNALGVSSNYDGTPCPYPGSFYFEKHLEIPASLNQNLGYKWWITMYLNVEDCNEYSDYGFSCKTSFSAESSDVNTHSTAAAAGVVFVCFACWAFMADRKRRVAQINLSHEEEQAGASGNFEMMSDTGVVA